MVSVMVRFAWCTTSAGMSSYFRLAAYAPRYSAMVCLSFVVFMAFPVGHQLSRRRLFSAETRILDYLAPFRAIGLDAGGKLGGRTAYRFCAVIEEPVLHVRPVHGAPYFHAEAIDNSGGSFRGSEY